MNFIRTQYHVFKGNWWVFEIDEIRILPVGKRNNKQKMATKLQKSRAVQLFTIEFNPKFKLTAELSDYGATFLDTTTYKGKRKCEMDIDLSTHSKPTENFQNTHFKYCQPPGVKRGFAEGEAIRLLRANSNESKLITQIGGFNKPYEVMRNPKMRKPKQKLNFKVEVWH